MSDKRATEMVRSHVPRLRHARVVSAVFLAAASLAAALVPDPAGAQTCPELGPTDSVCINLKTTPECGENCCTFLKENRRAALVIGNNDYSGRLKPLCNAGNDARALALKLKGQDFNVCCLLNATTNHINGAIDAAGRHLEDLDAIRPALQPSDTRFLMYFAGHGSHSTQTDADGLPLRSLVYGAGNYGSVSDERKNAVPIMTIRDDWRNYSAVHPVMVLDACRSPVQFPAEDVAAAPQPPQPMFAAATSFNILDALRSRRGGYVVLYSTRAGSIASDTVTAVSPAGSLSAGRFMKFFSDEIDSWGRPLSHIFRVVEGEVRRDSQSATPPDGQSPAKDDDSPIFDAWPWRAGAAACTKAINLIAKRIQEDDGGGSRCTDIPYSECVRNGTPSEDQCLTYKSQVGSLQDDTVCLSRIEQEFSPFFGANASRCAGRVAQPKVSARGFTRGEPLPEARVKEVAASSRRRPVVGRNMDDPVTRGIEETIPAFGHDTVEVTRRTTTRSPVPGTESATDVLERGQKLEVDCTSAMARCSSDVIAVRKPDGELTHVLLDDVSAKSTAQASVELVLEPGRNVPTPESLDSLESKGKRFVDNPRAEIRITAEVEKRGDATALAEAERRMGETELLMRAAGFKDQKISREYVELKQGLAASRIYVEFIEPESSR